MMLLELAGVRAAYGANQVLHGIDLTVAEGEIVCLLGNNAAGKSTLVKAVLGLVRVTGGSVRFAGKRIDGLKPDRVIALGFAVVPEDGQVFTNLTVLENLKMGLYLQRDEGAMRQAIERMFALYPVLEQRQHVKAGTMSGGERQMLAVARALVSGPRMLILDSPSMGLAPKYVHQQFETIRRLNREASVTVLLIEQNANMALALSHRGYVLQNGVIALSGDARDLLKNEQMRLAYLT
jgi:branched-chain amino acid transport system ATP-binding protein